MSAESATVTFTRTITAAAGVFAPGHVGELTRFLPFDLVDAVLTETVRVQRRMRDLPSRVIVYFVVALGMFPRLGYALVWDKLVAGLSELPLPTPTEAGLRQARRRVGPGPLRALFDIMAGPLARPDTAGVSYRGMRTVAFDGCSSFKTPDSYVLRGWLGKVRYRQGLAGYPQLMLMALVETGTRGLIGVRFGPDRAGEGGECGYARRLLHLLTPDMLLLMDRGFDSDDLLTEAAATAHLLVRVGDKRRPRVETTLSDGSYLTHFGDLRIRIIEAGVTTRLADGTVFSGRYRLATTLTDHRAHPATELVTLYHERWEIESAFYALRHTLFNGRVLRSSTPTGLQQELWGLLILYQAIRAAITEAAEQHPGADPDRASFTIAMEHARNQLINAAGILPDTLDATHAGAAATNTLPPRRDRVSQRRVKTPASRYAYPRATDPRPTSSTTVTDRHYTIISRTHTPPPTPRPGSLTDLTLTYLHTTAGQPCSAQDIATRTGITTRQAHFRLAKMVKNGQLIRTAPGYFSLAPPQPEPSHSSPTRVLTPRHET
ncbi:IS4 family transposase [Actinoplanes sp. GCM10030250]|uniref:IS4 family transposase n=1 Tax=Actinoplanes sp. GCM10030250 TaxID=3273376 RepID=UPI0036179F29